MAHEDATYTVYSTAEFDAQIEPLYTRFDDSFDAAELNLRDRLAERPTEGLGVGKGLYQVQLHFESKGQPAEATVITCVSKASEEVFLLAIYDAAEKRSPAPDELLVLQAQARDLIAD